MPSKETPSKEKASTDAPASLRTPARPGQPGSENEKRAEPSPASAHPTGPHPPFEPDAGSEAQKRPASDVRNDRVAPTDRQS